MEPWRTTENHEWPWTDTNNEGSQRFTYLVKKATFTDKLLSGFGIDGYCEPHMWHQELWNETTKEEKFSDWIQQQPDVESEVLVA